MHLRVSPHCFELSIICSFLLLNSFLLYECIVEGHLGSLLFSLIMNKAVVNFHFIISCGRDFFRVSKYLGSGITVS